MTTNTTNTTNTTTSTTIVEFDDGPSSFSTLHFTPDWITDLLDVEESKTDENKKSSVEEDLLNDPPFKIQHYMPSTSQNDYALRSKGAISNNVRDLVHRYLFFGTIICYMMKYIMNCTMALYNELYIAIGNGFRDNGIHWITRYYSSQ